jgi:transposase
MVGAEEQRNLFPEPAVPAGTTVINDRCLIRTEENFRIVIVSGIVLLQYAADDRMAEAYAMVSLVQQGWADQKEVARSFGYSARSVRRYQRRFESGGLAALGQAGGYPSGRPRLPRSREQLVRRLKGQGLGNREIARRLGVTPMAVRKLLKRLGWHERKPEQLPLPGCVAGGDPNLSAFPAAASTGVPETLPPPGDPNLSALGSLEDEPIPSSFDTDPADRRMDRLLAYLGVLEDAAPLFRSGTRVPHGGVLLALPALVASGVFILARKSYGSIGPAFYGLRTTLVALLLMALLRIKRPEALKERSPHDLGRVLGLDRAPEVKTVRRKLSRLAACGRAADFGRALAHKRVADRGAAMGFLYLDGHVRVYHGQRPLPKAHVARMRLAMPATTDYWVNDAGGDPLFVVTAEANAGMVKMLPGVLPRCGPSSARAGSPSCSIAGDTVPRSS